MYDKRVYWVWLQQALKSGNHKVNAVYHFYKTAKNFYDAGINDWRLCGIFTPKEIDSLSNFTLDKAQAIVMQCDAINQQIITMEDSNYPERLKNIKNSPCAIYVKGDISDIDNIMSITIVGTRRATKLGVESAFRFAYELAKEGVLIVSGGALGIDSAAHKGALIAGGKTICVLGCGINYPYVLENLSIRNVIAENGALISEYPPDCPPISRNFPIRNRIVSALSLGTVVIEAGLRSGSLITANLALEQNRDVFALPGNINIPSSNGANHLIKSGAKPVICVEDILEDYESLDFYKRLPCKQLDNYSKKILNESILKENNNLKKKTYNEAVKPKGETHKDENAKTKKIVLPDGISGNALKVYKVLTDKPMHIDDISILSEVSCAKTLQAITELELNGLIDWHIGRKYSKR